jgi:hypothetical protein
MTGHTSPRVIASRMGSAELAELAGLGERLHMSPSDSGQQVSFRLERLGYREGGRVTGGRWDGATSALLEYVDNSAVSGARRMSMFLPYVASHLVHAPR